ncbi:MAG: hypothetical protein ACLUR5_08930 [Eubacterium ventriosum]
MVAIPATVTRAAAIEGDQTVYFRTVNGSACRRDALYTPKWHIDL